MSGSIRRCRADPRRESEPSSNEVRSTRMGKARFYLSRECGFGECEEKWGRPCGRPHSHRRVGPGGRLTPGVSMPFSIALASSPRNGACRPALAPVPVPSGAGFDHEDRSRTPGGSETGLSIGASSGRDIVRRRCCTSAPDLESGLSDFVPPWFQRPGIGCRPKTILLPGLRHDGIRRVEAVPKSRGFPGC